MYFHVQIFEARLHLLARRVSTSNTGGWIRTLKILPTSPYSRADTQDARPDEHTLHDYVNAVLLNCRGLQAFSWECSARSLTFLVLSVAGASSMRSLDLYLDSKATAYMDRLNDFPSLDTLFLRLSAAQAPELEGARPLDLPNVCNLVWSWNSIIDAYDTDVDAAVEPEDVAVEYLSQCRFGPGCDITLGLEEATQAQIVMLNPFFDAHCDATRLVLRFSKLISSESTIMGVSDVTLDGSNRASSEHDGVLLSPTLFNQSSLPAIILLNMDLAHHVAILWDILNVLSRRNSLSPAVRLKLWFSDISKFCWDQPMDVTEDDLVGPLIARLLPYAIHLYARNVFLLDEQDNGLHKFFQ
jgi:hypothetical protein